MAVSPTPSRGGGGVSSLISKAMFEQMLKHRNDAACQGKREIAAFLAQTSHETTGGWATAPDGPYAWGYCFVTEQGNPGDYCVANQQYPCAAGKKYFGRGPIQIAYNFNYGPAGRAIGSNLLANPDRVATDPTISFQTALWFWMTPQSPKPSCHDVITGRWTPSEANLAAGLVPGYGVITNIINGGIECGKGSTPQQEDRIGFYKRYSDIMGVGSGNNLDCNNQSLDFEQSRSPRSSDVLLLQYDLFLLVGVDCHSIGVVKDALDSFYHY
ncbi:hypothetical protein RHSIM_Rhsim10G0202000 [Rhododendron simsii]|uniref:Glycoside hydrolase family 19 catalytic domain-containing protein n=1 Tax=Rhododendron simsii TaxID=118357 RepID=A0A834LE39_RHOSS|nr:hypothetical protein RHSIM_Rhsim10G0202000 [Rhododendron simsii]